MILLEVNSVDEILYYLIFNTEKVTPTQLLFAPHFENFFAGDITGIPDKVLLHFDQAGAVDPANSASAPDIKQLNETTTKRRIISGLKNLLGLNSILEIKEKYPNFPYQLDTIPKDDSSEESQVMVVCEDTLGHCRMYSVVELVSFFLSNLRQCAIDYMKKKSIKSPSGQLEDVSNLNRVILGIPAHFPEKKKDALKEAAFMAGFDEVGLEYRIYASDLNLL
jgi:molecular chaperone DnaK (HSP70)